ncbi:MAG TPA: hypothetical protein VJM11_00705, partial [Nevskiaceae bacterium]|nr:hypothetical protein [Nevskiaceae bacterium]
MQAGLRAAVAAVLMGTAGLASAAPMERRDVPDPLKPWIGWALHGQEARFCPPAHDDAGRRLCTWPSELSLSLDENGGRFELLARTDAPGFIPLPGDDAHWPQGVTVSGREVAALPKGAGPAVWVTPGEHRVAGRFDWNALPESLRVPPQVGLVELAINGKAVTHPGRDARSHLWLGRAPTAEPAAEAARLGLRVFRLIDDDLPARVTTRIEIDAGGEVREEVIGPVLLPGLVPLSVSGDLPARLEDDGRIRLQVRPGQWTVTLEARTTQPLAKLPVPKLAEPWPAQEVWSFEAHHDLRVVEAAGLAAVDPRQTGTPPDWQAMPAFLAEPGSELVFGEKQRGDPDPEPDQLRLARQVWLDFDGGGYTLQDQLSGKLSRTWRLDAQAPIALGRVQVDNEPQLITRNGESSGVEVRHGTLQLSADSRIDGGERRLPATGWNTDLQGVDVTLHLPPAWRLFAAPGADNVPQTWLSQWTLLDLFLVLVASIAAMRLFGIGTGLLTVITLAMTWHEPGAPRWTWLNLIAAIALLRAVPPSFGGNRLRAFLSAWRWIAVGALAFVAIPYAVDTARSSLYPQLENGPYAMTQAAGVGGVAGNAALEEVQVTAQAAREFDDSVAQDAMAPMAEPAPAPPPAPLEAEMKRKVERFAARKDAGTNVSQSSIQRLDPNVLTQTGPGLPGWQ